jgi:hypothetical protein
MRNDGEEEEKKYDERSNIIAVGVHYRSMYIEQREK